MQPRDTEDTSSEALWETAEASESDPARAQREQRVLVVAPDERDAEILLTAAAESGLAAERIDDITRVCAAVREGAGVVALADTGFLPEDLAALREALRTQPPWSDLPVLLICPDVSPEEQKRRLLELFEMLEPATGVILLRRPLFCWLLAKRIDAAMRTRRRQYQARDLLEQLDLERRREHAVLEALPVGVLVTDAGGRVLETNAAFHRLWGADRPLRQLDDFRTFEAHQAGAGAGARPWEWRYSRVLATGQPVIGEELEIEASDGARSTVLSSAFPIHDGRGRVAGLVGVQVDISELARARQARQILSETSAALTESLDAGVTLRALARIVVSNIADCCAIDEMDDHGQLRRLVAETSGANTADEAARLLAYTPAASGNSLAARVLRSGRPLLVSEVPADWHATGLEADEHRAAFANLGAYSLMVLPLIARGRPLGVLGIVSTRPDRRYEGRDLALAEELSRRAALALDNARMHRAAEVTIRARDEALAEYYALLATSHVGFCVVDRALQIQRINDVLAEMAGLSPEETLGRPLERVVPPAVEAQLAPLLYRVLATGRSVIQQSIVGELPPGAGRTRHFRASFAPLFDIAGTPRAVGVIVSDVTQMKDAEDALREEAAFRERFLGVLAHDLRNPLQAIVLSAGSLSKKSDAPESWLRSMGSIARSAGRMERMVGSLLDLVRSRAGGGIAVTRKPADLAAIVREVAAEVEAAHPRRRIEVSVSGDTRAELDADRIAQVVCNLVTNALAYSPVSEVVRVAVSSGDGELTLAVHNRGVPIARRALERIFAPFKRGADAGGGPPSMHGLDLGLFIVREIAQAHGGTIEATSSAEAGTTFTVHLPRASAAASVVARGPHA